MKKRLVTMLLSIILLMTAGCQAAESQPQETPTESTTVEENPSENDLPEEPVEETEEEGDYVTTGGIPWINSDIKENITAITTTAMITLIFSQLTAPKLPIDQLCRFTIFESSANVTRNSVTAEHI